MAHAAQLHPVQAAGPGQRSPLAGSLAWSCEVPTARCALPRQAQQTVARCPALWLCRRQGGVVPRPRPGGQAANHLQEPPEPPLQATSRHIRPLSRASDPSQAAGGPNAAPGSQRAQRGSPVRPPGSCRPGPASPLARPQAGLSPDPGAPWPAGTIQPHRGSATPQHPPPACLGLPLRPKGRWAPTFCSLYTPSSFSLAIRASFSERPTSAAQQGPRTGGPGWGPGTHPSAPAGTRRSPASTARPSRGPPPRSGCTGQSARHPQRVLGLGHKLASRSGARLRGGPRPRRARVPTTLTARPWGPRGVPPAPAPGPDKGLRAPEANLETGRPSSVRCPESRDRPRLPAAGPTHSRPRDWGSEAEGALGQGPCDWWGLGPRSRRD